MLKLCKDCKWYKEINYILPKEAEDDYYYKCQHPRYHHVDMVTGRVTFNTCREMRTKGPCRLKAELFEAK